MSKRKRTSKIEKWIKEGRGSGKETVNDFQIKRCYKIIDQMLLENEPILLGKVQGVGAVKSHHFHKIKLQL
jgi:hypothetical protein